MHQKIDQDGQEPFEIELAGRVWYVQARYDDEGGHQVAHVWEHTDAHDIISVVLYLKDELDDQDMEFIARCGAALIMDKINSATRLVAGYTEGMAKH